MSDGRALRVLAVEPFHGGSHRQFLEQWARHSRHRFDPLTFPGRHWKWRMRHAAVSAAREIGRRLEAGASWDVLWASDMLDLATLRGLCPEVAALPTVLYLHENQATYPVRGAAPDLHFAYTNFTSALAADRVWFNSDFHRRAWLEALPPLLRRFPDHPEDDLVERIRERSRVQWPGVEEVEDVDGTEGAEDRGGPADPPEVTWAARWEHDKNPEELFAALDQVERLRPGLSWRLNVLGPVFREVPACFAEARRRFAPRIVDWGFLERDAYLAALCRTSVFVSTAIHEFFGMSAVEAMVAGARPLLPDRLSYPELVGGDPSALWDGGPEVLAGRLIAVLESSTAGEPKETEGGWRSAVRRFLWSRRAPELDRGLEEVFEGHSRGR